LVARSDDKDVSAYRNRYNFLAQNYEMSEFQSTMTSERDFFQFSLDSDDKRFTVFLMLIANPVYDTVFKYLMSDLDIAKGIISIILEQEIFQLSFKSQESNYQDDTGDLKVYHNDFIALIQTGANEYKNVLIEIQQAKIKANVRRFRDYLGEQYKKLDEIKVDGKTEKEYLPIISIYILNYILDPELPSVIKVDNNYFDLLTGIEVKRRVLFLEQLTHRSYFIQVPKLDLKLQTKLEWVLSIFEQKYFVEDKRTKEYSYHTEDSFIEKILTKLNVLRNDKSVMEELEIEERAWQEFDQAVKTLHDDLMEELQTKDKELQSKDKELEVKDNTILTQEQELKEKDRIIAELKRRMNL
jgi:hypothetical protein